jgi:hypothetical protein
MPTVAELRAAFERTPQVGPMNAELSQALGKGGFSFPVAVDPGATTQAALDQAREALQHSFLAAWVARIVVDIQEGMDDLPVHIAKHAGFDLQNYLADGRDLTLWAAGMQNLLDIFTALHGCRPTVRDQLERLQAKYDSNPSFNTAPPVPDMYAQDARAVGPGL